MLQASKLLVWVLQGVKVLPRGMGSISDQCFSDPHDSCACRTSLVSPFQALNLGLCVVAFFSVSFWGRI